MGHLVQSRASVSLSATNTSVSTPVGTDGTTGVLGVHQLGHRSPLSEVGCAEGFYPFHSIPFSVIEDGRHSCWRFV